MQENINKYIGREQSFIKHFFLTEYLKAAAYKILQSRSRSFNFIDAFAGPWRVSDDDNSDASFEQALRTLEVVRSHLGRHGVAGIKIRFCFCERKAKAVERLRSHAEKRRRFDIHIFEGAFEDRLDDISKTCRDGFTFTFIDPTGWNIRSEPVFEFLRSQNGEFLLNFMAEHVNRHAEYSMVSASFGRFLADPDWSADYEKLPPELRGEEGVLHLLRRKIKATSAAKYAPDFPILKPRENRVKMRLVLGTNSRKGLEVFRNVQGKVERREIATRNQIRSGDQGSLFTDDVIAARQQNEAGVGCPAFQQKAKELVVALLSHQREQNFDYLSSEILESIPIKISQINSLFNEMKKRKIIEFDLPSRKRVPQPGTIISLVE